MFRFRRWLEARVIDILNHQVKILSEMRIMRASTQHLTDAVSALATSVAAGNDQIKTELDALIASNANDDDAAVEASVQKIKNIAKATDDAVAAAKTALTTVPADPAQGKVDPAALGPDTATNTTGKDPASGAPAGQGAVGAGST